MREGDPVTTLSKCGKKLQRVPNAQVEESVLPTPQVLFDQIVFDNFTPFSAGVNPSSSSDERDNKLVLHGTAPIYIQIILALLRSV